MYPYPPVTIARALYILGVESINTRDRPDHALLHYSGRCNARLNALLRYDLAPNRYTPFSSAIERFYSMSVRNQETAGRPERANVTDCVERPCSLIRRHYAAHLAISAHTSTPESLLEGDAASVKLPRATYNSATDGSSTTPSSADAPCGPSPTALGQIPHPKQRAEKSISSRTRSPRDWATMKHSTILQNK